MTVQEYLQQIFEYLTIDVQDVRLDEDDQYLLVYLTVEEDEAGKMIGKHGETLTSLAHLVSVSFYDELSAKKVVVDVNGYKARREEEAVAMGRQAAERVVASGRPHHMPRSLQAHQRRVIHQDLQDFVGVSTTSEGEGRDRHLVIYPAEE